MRTKPEVTEFAATEVCTAIVAPLYPETKDRLTGGIAVGFYPGDGLDPETVEVWLEQEGRRIQFTANTIKALVEQIRRAAEIAGRATTPIDRHELPATDHPKGAKE